MSKDVKDKNGKVVVDVKHPHTADEMKQKISYLKAKRDELSKEISQWTTLEKTTRAQEEHEQEFSDAMKLLNYMKQRQLTNGSTAYDWMMNEMSNEQNDEQHNNIQHDTQTEYQNQE